LYVWYSEVDGIKLLTCYLQALSLYTPTSKVTSIHCYNLNLTEERIGQYSAMP